MSDNRITWDLKSLLQGLTVDQAIANYSEAMQNMIKNYETFLDTEQNFINFLNQYEEFVKISNRLENYLYNSKQENLSDPQITGYIQKFLGIQSEFIKVFSNYDNLVIKNEKLIRKYLQNNEIKEYQRLFDLTFRDKDHLLSDEQEMLLAELSESNGAMDDIFSTLTENDFSYAPAINNNNEIVQIHTQADVFKNLRSKDENLRKTTWYSFHKAFFQYRHTLTKTLYYNYLNANKIAKLRNFKDYISMVAFNDEVDKDFIQMLYENVKSYKPIVQKYKQARDKYLKYLLKKDKLMPWDNNIELTHDDKVYTWPEIQDIAINALSILGDEYVSVVKKAFDEKWISYLPSPTKQTGAYSIGGTKGLDKYFISMNFDSTIQSAFTLVHELGHSMNSYYYGKAQRIYQSTKIFYAEIASITNEVILSNYLSEQEKDNPQLRLMILDQMISEFFNTTSRQIIFSNFEWIANDWINKHEPFTYSRIAETYLHLMREYLGTITDQDEYKKEPLIYSLITPLRISHFYTNEFYVYKYAIGQIAAILIGDEILNNVPGAQEKLFNFLKSGSSLSPLETIKLLGIDLKTNEPYTKVKTIITRWVDEFSNLVDSLLPKN